MKYKKQERGGNVKSVLTKEEADFVEKLITDNEKHIKNVVFNTLGAENRQLAEDCINDFYLLMCEKVEILKNHPCPKAWILVAAKHTAQGCISRRKKDISSVSMDEIAEESSDDDVFEDTVYAIWLENKVPERIIESLTKRERELYYKIYIENKKPKEAAKELDISVSTVHNIHKNMKEKIKNRVKEKNF